LVLVFGIGVGSGELPVVQLPSVLICLLVEPVLLLVPLLLFLPEFCFVFDPDVD
jgi:hypothetical protein